jgi:hypothetical protein
VLGAIGGAVRLQLVAVAGRPFGDASWLCVSSLRKASLPCFSWGCFCGARSSLEPAAAVTLPCGALCCRWPLLQVLQVLQQSLADVKAERDAAHTQLDAIKTQVGPPLPRLRPGPPAVPPAASLRAVPASAAASGWPLAPAPPVSLLPHGSLRALLPTPPSLPRAPHAQLLELQGSLEDKVKALSGLGEVAEDIKFDLDRHAARFWPADKVSEQPAAAIGASDVFRKSKGGERRGHQGSVDVWKPGGQGLVAALPARVPGRQAGARGACGLHAPRGTCCASPLHAPDRPPTPHLSTSPVPAVRIDSKGQYVASPSLVKLPGGRLLAALERAVTWGQTKETTMKLVYSSDDGGSSWQRAAVVGPMNWPQVRRWGRMGVGREMGKGNRLGGTFPAPASAQDASRMWACGHEGPPARDPHPHRVAHPRFVQVFSCASGVYMMGTERHFSPNNNLVISKMLDDKGARRCARCARSAGPPSPGPAAPPCRRCRPRSGAPGVLCRLLHLRRGCSCAAGLLLSQRRRPRLPASGTSWSVPTKLTSGLSVVRWVLPALHSAPAARSAPDTNAHRGCCWRRAAKSLVATRS